MSLPRLANAAAAAAIAAALLASAAAPAARGAAPGLSFAPAADPAVRYIGRVDRRHPRHVRFDWPGVAVETRFAGTSCAALLRGDGGLYDVSVDGAREIRRFDTLETAHTLAAGLVDSIHSLRIVKRTEGLRGQIVTLKGFYVDAGKSLLPPLGAMPDRRIEFIGGSNLLGFGAEADTVWCDTPANYSNVSLSFGAAAAKAVGAEYRVLAASGKGLVRNWKSPYFAATRPFGPLYRRTLKNDSSALWDFKSWIPQAVVTCFGTNDFSTHPHPTKALYIETYRDFLYGVRARYPDAHIVCVTSAREPARTYVREMAKQEREREEWNGKIHFYSFEEVPKERCGCDWHPNAGAHEEIGRGLAEILGPLLESKSLKD